MMEGDLTAPGLAFLTRILCFLFAQESKATYKNTKGTK